MFHLPLRSLSASSHRASSARRRAAALAALSTCFLGASSARADLIVEGADFGNTRASAFNLNGLLSSSSNGAGDNVYGIGDPTAIIRGAIGVANDVDFFSFSGMGGQQFYFDVDTTNRQGSLPDSFLSLFDDTGTLIARGDEIFNETEDSTFDPGSTSGNDAFLGVYTLTGDSNTSRTYYLAITDFKNRATASPDEADFDPDFGNAFQLVRPTTGEGQPGEGFDGDITNIGIVNVTPGDDSFLGGSDTATGRGTYTLNVTQIGSTAPVPEPSTWAMMGLGVLAMVGISRRRKHQIGDSTPDSSGLSL